MVVLWVVFEDLGLLRVIEVSDQVVKIELCPPGLALEEPEKILVRLHVQAGLYTGL
jgi:hypothetical protein